MNLMGQFSCEEPEAISAENRLISGNSEFCKRPKYIYILYYILNSVPETMTDIRRPPVWFWVHRGHPMVAGATEGDSVPNDAPSARRDRVEVLQDGWTLVTRVALC